MPANNPRYLTKSIFKLARQCPSKLFYTGKSDYANQTVGDSFLAELANGGFQVGELAKCYFPGGKQVMAKDAAEAAAETADLLRDENVIIFEAAFQLDEKFFIRADIVVKRGDRIDLIEVKAKSCNFAEESGFLNKDGTVVARWLPYIEDIAFQKYIVKRAMPGFTVSAFLMLVDKTAHCPTDGLNQKFQLVTEDGKRSIRVSATLTEEDLGEKILCLINVDRSCDKVYDGTAVRQQDKMSFEEKIAMYADHYVRDVKIESPISTACKPCEFRLADGETGGKSKSGFRECWGNAYPDWQDKDFEEPTVLDIWKLSKQMKEALIARGKIKISDIKNREDIAPRGEGASIDRQWRQVEKELWIDKEGLKKEMITWTYPLHFIDFETSMPAIPFKKGRRPYEGVAFQFSHHVVEKDGRVEHRGEFLSVTPGVFPNYEFVRELKRQLETDKGSIFRYHDHENNFLNAIYGQLHADRETVPDYKDLCDFIETITKSNDRQQGDRCMIDLYELVKSYYYHPATNGSISIKDVLPAILNGSEFLRNKYSSPIYGTENEIPSHNFTDHRWVVFDGEKVRNPYKLLPKLFTEMSDEESKVLVSQLEAINDGGAAMTAYGKLQFQEMGGPERSALESALLKYCELDTLAMVMIYEAWQAEVYQGV